MKVTTNQWDEKQGKWIMVEKDMDDKKYCEFQQIAGISQVFVGLSSTDVSNWGVVNQKIKESTETQPEVTEAPELPGEKEEKVKKVKVKKA